MDKGKTVNQNYCSNNNNRIQIISMVSAQQHDLDIKT